MRFGFHLFATDPAELHPLALACEQSGWDHLAMADAPFYPEHVSAPYPHTPDGKRFWDHKLPTLEPWLAIAHMAAVTQRLRFMTAILRMPIRKPLLEAKSLCSAAALSGDRIAVGLGLGWMPEEYRFTNEEQKTRGARMTEAIQILKLCMTGEFVEFHGEHYDFDRLSMCPVPQSPVPIYAGGHADAALRRAARWCDGWIGLTHPFAEGKAIIDRLTELRSEYGREREPFDIVIQCTDATTLDDFRRLEDIGVTHNWVVPWHSPLLYAPRGGELGMDISVMFDEHPSLDRKIDAIRRFGDEVIAKLG